MAPSSSLSAWLTSGVKTKLGALLLSVPKSQEVGSKCFQPRSRFPLKCLLSGFPFPSFSFFSNCVSMLEEKWHIAEIQAQINISMNISQNNIEVKHSFQPMFQDMVSLGELN